MKKALKIRKDRIFTELMNGVKKAGLENEYNREDIEVWARWNLLREVYAKKSKRFVKKRTNSK